METILAIGNIGEIVLQIIILLLALTVHESAHAWSANRLGDPTARMLGRITLNPIAHIDLFGTVLFPILLMITGMPVFGWAKPVPVNLINLRRPRRDYAWISAGRAVEQHRPGLGGHHPLPAVDLHAPREFFAQGAGLFLFWCAAINLILAAFNLIRFRR